MSLTRLVNNFGDRDPIARSDSLHGVVIAGPFLHVVRGSTEGRTHCSKQNGKEERKQ